jgi:hypothetical protein
MRGDPTGSHWIAFSSLTHSHHPEVEVMLRPTISRPVYLGVRHPSGAHDQIPITVGQLRASWSSAPSLTKGWVYSLQLLLGLASTVILGFESHRIYDHISLSRIWDSTSLEVQARYLYPPVIPPGTGFPFRRLLPPAGLLSSYSPCWSLPR